MRTARVTAIMFGGMKIEKEKIGKVVYFGGEHIVRKYGCDSVIKFPFGPRFILGRKRIVDRITRRYKIVKEYFGKYLHDTQIIVGKNRRSYVYVQKELDGEPLNKELMKNPQIKKQFLEIVSINETLIKEKGVTWEFFGALGLLFTGDRCVRNCLALKDGRLEMVDAGIIPLDLDNHPLLLKIILGWSLKRQKRFLKSFLEKSGSL